MAGRTRIAAVAAVILLAFAVPFAIAYMAGGGTAAAPEPTTVTRGFSGAVTATDVPDDPAPVPAVRPSPSLPALRVPPPAPSQPSGPTPSPSPSPTPSPSPSPSPSPPVEVG